MILGKFQNFFFYFFKRIFKNQSLIYFLFIFFLGRSRLGICGHGFRSIVFVDICHCIISGHIYDIGWGTISIRWYQTHWCGTICNCTANLQSNWKEILNVLSKKWNKKINTKIKKSIIKYLTTNDNQMLTRNINNLI